jgi:hypothetical protein
LPSARNGAKAIENSGFSANPDRILLNAKPLTTGSPEFTRLKFGSPRATVFITENGEFGREFGKVEMVGAGQTEDLIHRKVVGSNPIAEP